MSKISTIFTAMAVVLVSSCGKHDSYVYNSKEFSAKFIDYPEGSNKKDIFILSNDGDNPLFLEVKYSIRGDFVRDSVEKAIIDYREKQIFPSPERLK